MESDGQKLERYLEAGLRQYGIVPPSPGLEERVLRELRTETGRHPLRVQWPALAALAAVAMLVAAWLGAHRTQRSQTPVAVTSQQEAKVHASKPQAKPATVVEVHKSLHAARKRKVTRGARRLAADRRAKMDQFPSVLISEQDKLLLVYAQRTPKQQILAVIADQKSPGDLHIKSLEIPPLE